MSNSSKSSLQGYLKEQTAGLFTGYKKYYFVLNDGKLSKFKDDSQSKIKDELQITTKTVHAVVEASKLSGKKNTFAIMFAGKPPKVFLAENEAECTKWQEALRANLSADQQELNEASVVASVEGLVDVAIVTDAQCHIIGWNAAAEKLLGHKKEEVLGKNIIIIMPEKYASVHDNYVQQYHVTGNKRMIGFPRQLVAKHKDGTLLPVIVSLGEAPGQEEGKQCFVGVIRPIEMKPMERQDSLENLAGQGNPNQQLLPYLQKSKDRLVNRVVELVATKGLAPLQEEFTKLQRAYTRLQKRLSELENEHSQLSKQSQYLQDQYKDTRLEVLQLRPFYEKVLLVDVLSDNEAYTAFEAFCKSRHCAESVLFCKRAIDFSKKYFAVPPNDDKAIMDMRKEANDILDDFIYDHSIYNINTNKQLRSQCISKLANPTANMFDTLVQ